MMPTVQLHSQQRSNEGPYDLSKASTLSAMKFEDSGAQLKGGEASAGFVRRTRVRSPFPMEDPYQTEARTAVQWAHYHMYTQFKEHGMSRRLKYPSFTDSLLGDAWAGNAPIVPLYSSTKDSKESIDSALISLPHTRVKVDDFKAWQREDQLLRSEGKLVERPSDKVSSERPTSTGSVASSRGSCTLGAGTWGIPTERPRKTEQDAASIRVPSADISLKDYDDRSEIARTTEDVKSALHRVPFKKRSLWQAQDFSADSREEILAKRSRPEPDYESRSKEKVVERKHMVEDFSQQRDSASSNDDLKTIQAWLQKLSESSNREETSVKQQPKVERKSPLSKDDGSFSQVNLPPLVPIAKSSPPPPRSTPAAIARALPKPPPLKRGYPARAPGPANIMTTRVKENQATNKAYLLLPVRLTNLIDQSPAKEARPTPIEASAVAKSPIKANGVQISDTSMDRYYSALQQFSATQQLRQQKALMEREQLRALQRRRLERVMEGQRKTLQKLREAEENRSRARHLQRRAEKRWANLTPDARLQLMKTTKPEDLLKVLLKMDFPTKSDLLPMTTTVAASDKVSNDRVVEVSISDDGVVTTNTVPSTMQETHLTEKPKQSLTTPATGRFRRIAPATHLPQGLTAAVAMTAPRVKM